MKKNGNAYLLDLFKGNEIKLLDFIFSTIYLIDKDLVETLNAKIDRVRNTKDMETYYLEDDKFIKMKMVKSKTDKMKRLAKANNLYVKNDNLYENVKLDSTGNYAITKVLKSELNLILSKKEEDFKNYNISHVWKKPNTVAKHCFNNIVLIPTFLDHFINKGLELDSKNILNILKALMVEYYSLEKNPDNDDNFKVKESELQYAHQLIKDKTFNTLRNKF